MILLELIIAFKRLLITSNISFSLKIRFKTTILSSFTISIGLFLPYAVSLRIVNQRDCQKTYENKRCLNNSTNDIYAITQENVPHLDLLKNLYWFTISFRTLIAPFLLILVNIAVIIKFKRLCDSKLSLTRVNQLYLRQSKSKSKQTFFMINSISFDFDFLFKFKQSSQEGQAQAW